MNQLQERLNKLITDYPELEKCKAEIEKAVNILINTYKTGGKLLVCGNGGSAADSGHIVGELVKGFMQKRPLPVAEKEKIIKRDPETGKYLSENLQQGLPAIALTDQMALITAFSNDVAADMIFAQQVYVYGNKEDTVLGISTSGNSKNVVNALKIGSYRGLNTIGLTGKDGGEIKEICDSTIVVPADSTPEIQERHLPIYHALCEIVEAEFF